jgi:hypothetical protein
MGRLHRHRKLKDVSMKDKRVDELRPYNPKEEEKLPKVWVIETYFMLKI